MEKRFPAHVSILDFIEKLLEEQITATSEDRVAKATSILSKIIIPQSEIKNLRERIDTFSKKYVKHAHFQDWFNLLNMATEHSDANKTPYHEVIMTELKESIKTLKETASKGNPTEYPIARTEAVLDIMSTTCVPWDVVEDMLLEVYTGFYNADSWGLTPKRANLLEKRFGIVIASLQKG